MSSPDQLKRRRQNALESGRCPVCIQNPPREGVQLCQMCTDKTKKIKNKHHTKLRKEVLTAYGHTCKCCGVSDFEFLTLDHVNNDGASHRKELKAKHGSVLMLRWAKKNNYPDVLQVLCWNCNSAKQYHGVCPHRMKVING